MFNETHLGDFHETDPEDSIETHPEDFNETHPEDSIEKLPIQSCPKIRPVAGLSSLGRNILTVYRMMPTKNPARLGV